MLIRKPVEEVFEAMINPDITSTFWFTKSSGRVEPWKTLEWEGGQFSYVVDRDGQRINHMGTYREIQRPNRLVFTWGVDVEAGDESVVTITILPAESGCRLTLVHTLDPKWEEYKDRTQEGWSYMIGKLNKLLIGS